MNGRTRQNDDDEYVEEHETERRRGVLRRTMLGTTTRTIAYEINSFIYFNYV